MSDESNEEVEEVFNDSFCAAYCWQVDLHPHPHDYLSTTCARCGQRTGLHMSRHPHHMKDGSCAGYLHLSGDRLVINRNGRALNRAR